MLTEVPSLELLAQHLPGSASLCLCSPHTFIARAVRRRCIILYRSISNVGMTKLDLLGGCTEDTRRSRRCFSLCILTSVGEQIVARHVNHEAFPSAVKINIVYAQCLQTPYHTPVRSSHKMNIVLMGPGSSSRVSAGHRKTHKVCAKPSCDDAKGCSFPGAILIAC